MREEPVVIIGMHRSGTSILTKILQEAGLFMGIDKDPNDESLFFLEFNNWIFQQINATWDCPEPYNFTSNTFKEYIAKIGRTRVQSIEMKKYWGLKNYIKYRYFQKIDSRWGWKDPRTSITLDIWQKIYPKMKVIHIYRNPVDVAHSLQTRAIMEENNFINQTDFNPHKYHQLKRPLRYTGSFKIMHLEKGYDLWKEYVSKSLEAENALHIKYEELLAHPEQYLSKIFEYLNITISKEDISQFSNMFNVNRKYAFTKESELIDFYKKIKNDPIMKTLHYQNILEEE